MRTRALTSSIISQNIDILYDQKKISVLFPFIYEHLAKHIKSFQFTGLAASHTAQPYSAWKTKFCCKSYKTIKFVVQPSSGTHLKILKHQALFLQSKQRASTNFVQTLQRMEPKPSKSFPYPSIFKPMIQMETVHQTYRVFKKTPEFSSVTILVNHVMDLQTVFFS